MRGVKIKAKAKLILANRLVWVSLALIIVILIWLGYRFIYDNPNEVFEAMLSNSLSTSGYIKTIKLSVNGETINEKILLQFGGVNRVQELETYQLQAGIGVIVTDNIGTPYTDYGSYKMISTIERDQNGHIINYSPAVGKWGVDSSYGPKVTGGQLFNSSVFDIVPIGDVTQSQRSQLLNYIKSGHVYTVSKKVTKQLINGRTQYVYIVEVNSGSLYHLIEMFGKDLGFNGFNQSADDNLPTTPTAEYKFYVDSSSRNLTQVSSINGTGIEALSSYGIKQSIPLPNKTIPLNSLEALVENLSNK